MINSRYIEGLREDFVVFAKKEANRFRNLGVITNKYARFYLDSDGKVTFDPQKYTVCIYYNKQSNNLYGDVILKENIIEKAFSYKMPRPTHIFDRSKWIN